MIYDYLYYLHDFPDESQVIGKPGIVFIDEIDAHIHPTWQKKIIPILKDRFPNVQFIVTAHNPLVVLGRFCGQVSILEQDNSSGKFKLETSRDDYRYEGAASLYQELFSVTPICDDAYSESFIESVQRVTESEIETLREKAEILPKEKERLKKLELELEKIKRGLRE